MLVYVCEPNSQDPNVAKRWTSELLCFSDSVKPTEFVKHAMRESKSSSLNCDWACSHLLTRCCSHFGADLIRGPCDNWLKVEVTRQVKRTANLSITLHSDANFITLRGLSSRGCGFSRLPFFVWWRSPSIRASKHKQSSIPAAEVLEKSKQLAGLPRRSIQPARSHVTQRRTKIMRLTTTLSLLMPWLFRVWSQRLLIGEYGVKIFSVHLTTIQTAS